MRLYETARRAVVPFEPPPRPAEVRIYVCGITPYDSTHLGHANTYLAYDLLIRRLEDLGHRVRMVRNITDVDDSILPKARELGVDFLELAAAETARFHCDMEDLNTRPPAAEPKATEWVDEMVAHISQLAAAGHAYTVEGTTWFDVSTWPDFGRLSGYDDATMRALAAERGGTPDDPRQRNPLDFVLWQPSAPDEPVWESPFGPGRPGWHIECSAMSMALLGARIDIHGGGSDLIFPHHECELAQSEAATGETFVRHWMHCGMVGYDGAKMSKSLGNLVFVSDLCKDSAPAAVRLALMLTTTATTGSGTTATSPSPSPCSTPSTRPSDGAEALALRVVAPAGTAVAPAQATERVTARPTRLLMPGGCVKRSTTTSTPPGPGPCWPRWPMP